MSTKIEWTDETINPIVGCSKISEGCLNCYAEKMAWRLKCMGIPKYQDVVDENGWTGKIGVDMSVFDKLPRKPKKIFVSSMGDLWHKNVDWPTIDNVFEACLNTPQHIYIFLTKRIEAAWYYFNSPVYPEHKTNKHRSEYLLKNIWLGTSVENQEMADLRTNLLLQIPAKVRFVSVEPMLGPIKISKYLRGKGRCGAETPYLWYRIEGIDWVIAGPETGPGKRECKPEWIWDLYEQCQAAGIPFFDKTKKNWLAREFPTP